MEAEQLLRAFPAWYTHAEVGRRLDASGQPTRSRRGVRQQEMRRRSPDVDTDVVRQKRYLRPTPSGRGRTSGALWMTYANSKVCAADKPVEDRSPGIQRRWGPRGENGDDVVAGWR